MVFIKLTQRSMHLPDFFRIIGAILIDLSKAYDSLPHNLILAKLEAYELYMNSLRFLFDYLTCRKQRTEIGSAHSN